ncbi:hypothetical protein, partial [Serratia marcescens]|uniref:hypothetical protein n=1 Tax=Serratia marcescens TaxID=615 RepID=UPI0034E25565
ACAKELAPNAITAAIMILLSFIEPIFLIRKNAYSNQEKEQQETCSRLYVRSPDSLASCWLVNCQNPKASTINTSITASLQRPTH